MALFRGSQDCAEPCKPGVVQQPLTCSVCSTHVQHPRLVLSCVGARQLSNLACQDPACLVHHNQDSAKQMQHKCIHGDAVHSIASEIKADSAHTTWPHCTATISDTESESDATFELLGMLVAVVDNAASDFVYGPAGTPGRPDGVLDVSFLCSMASGHLLGAVGYKRWMQFLHVWQNAGWSLQALLQVTDELRPLQYGFDLEMADLANVQAAQLYCCIAEYCDQAQDQTETRISSFLAVVQKHFSQHNAVLMPAEDAFERLAMIQLC